MSLAPENDEEWIAVQQFLHDRRLGLTKARPIQMQVDFRLEREDSMPGFAAFLRCEPDSMESPVILVNVQAVMAPELEDENDNLVPMTREERRRLLITSLMHEFGHLLERYFRVPMNEDAIEKACQDWENAYMQSQPNPPEGI
jgi:hypothetical protein